MKLLKYLPALALIFAGCATKSTAPNAQPGAKIGEAVIAPLADLNLVRTKIPQVLNDAKANPYLHPHDMSCAGLKTEISALDDALGPDLDAPKPSSDQSAIQKGGTMAGESAIDALRSTTESVIPFRSWVRKLTGAERHSREVTNAIAAGIVRRAYLKGLGESRGCAAPAAPLPPAPPTEQKAASPDQAKP